MDTPHLYPLTQSERIDAMEQAKQSVIQLAGDRPRREQFQNTAGSEFGGKTSLMFTLLAVLVAVAAFLPSAMRLYQIGYITFGHAIQHRPSQTAAGISSIMLAESGVLAFSLFKATLNDKRTIRTVYGFIGLFSLYALVGNIQLALPNHWHNPFAWLEAVVPPVAVLGAGIMLERQLLEYLRQRHADQLAYLEAVDNWKIATARPDHHPRFNQFYANALRDALRGKNSKGRDKAKQDRLDYIASLTDDQWRALVLAEIRADNWFNIPADPQLTRVRVNSSDPQLAIGGESLSDHHHPNGSDFSRHRETSSDQLLSELVGDVADPKLIPTNGHNGNGHK